MSPFSMEMHAIITVQFTDKETGVIVFSTWDGTFLSAADETEESRLQTALTEAMAEKPHWVGQTVAIMFYRVMPNHSNDWVAFEREVEEQKRG